jgi:hypothetical protein
MIDVGAQPGRFLPGTFPQQHAVAATKRSAVPTLTHHLWPV